MKISPIAHAGAAAQTHNPNSGSSASPDRIARAKAIVTGDPVQERVNSAPAESTQDKLRRIRMSTQATPGPREYATAEPTETAAAVDNSDPIEPGAAASEDPKPLSPQFAALAKRQRALQVKEREIQAREEALKQAPQSTTDAKTLLERMKADPLGLLLENGVTYDQLTQAVLRDMEGGSPALTKVEAELRTELSNVKKLFEDQAKSQTEERTKAEQFALAQMQRKADQLIAADDTYQLIRETGSNKDVTALIEAVRKEEGTEISIEEALDLVESDLLEESLKIARIQKVQERAAPSSQQTTAAQPQDGTRRQTMRTLTNRDTVSAIPSRRERAIAAALGKKLT